MASRFGRCVSSSSDVPLAAQAMPGRTRNTTVERVTRFAGLLALSVCRLPQGIRHHLAPIRSLCPLGLALAALAGHARAFAQEQRRVDLASIVRLTYENNLRVTASRFDVEAAEIQFQQFERSRSQFRPLQLESTVSRSGESSLEDRERMDEFSERRAVTVGSEKEFFDGSRLGAAAGMRELRDDEGRDYHPFVEFDARVPLFSSATRLQRITDRSFEESEMLGSWLDFIGVVRGRISDSIAAYLRLQYLREVHRLAAGAQTDFALLLEEQTVTGRQRDTNLLRDQVQAYQSRVVGASGEIASALLALLNSVGLPELQPGDVAPIAFEDESIYGARYLAVPPALVLAEAMENDIEVRVLHIARDNARLKRSLAERGRWDIAGRLSAGYDFESRGDDPSRRRGYSLGVALSVEHNDPQLLRLSLRRATAEERKYSARIEHRQREIESAIRRRLGEAASLRAVVSELKASRELRRSVHAEKRQAYLDGEESLDNLIQARGQLYSTERDLLSALREYYDTMIDLDEASGAYFAQLGDIADRLEKLGFGTAGEGKQPAPPPGSTREPVTAGGT